MHHDIKCCCGTCNCPNIVSVPSYVTSALCSDCSEKDHQPALSVASDTKPVIELSEDFEGFCPQKKSTPTAGVISNSGKEKLPFFAQ